MLQVGQVILSLPHSLSQTGMVAGAHLGCARCLHGMRSLPPLHLQAAMLDPHHLHRTACPSSLSARFVQHATLPKPLQTTPPPAPPTHLPAGIAMLLLFASLAMWTTYLMVILYLDNKNRKIKEGTWCVPAKACYASPLPRLLFHSLRCLPADPSLPLRSQVTSKSRCHPSPQQVQQGQAAHDCQPVPRGDCSDFIWWPV